MDKEEEVIKTFHFKRENYDKGPELEQLKKQFIMKFRTLKEMEKEYPKEEMTSKEKELSEMAKEFITLCQKKYGEEIQRFEEEKNEATIIKLYKTLNSLICDLYEFNQSVEKYFNKRGMDPKRKMEGYIVSVSDTKTETAVRHTKPNLISFINLEEEGDQER
jgi:hypothetical protein